MYYYLDNDSPYIVVSPNVDFYPLDSVDGAARHDALERLRAAIDTELGTAGGDVFYGELRDGGDLERLWLAICRDGDVSTDTAVTVADVIAALAPRNRG